MIFQNEQGVNRSTNEAHTQRENVTDPAAKNYMHQVDSPGMRATTPEIIELSSDEPLSHKRRRTPKKGKKDRKEKKRRKKGETDREAVEDRSAEAQYSNDHNLAGNGMGRRAPGGGGVEEDLGGVVGMGGVVQGGGVANGLRAALFRVPSRVLHGSIETSSGITLASRSN